MAPRTILSLRHKEAKNFFLRPTTYCNVDLPPYFDFSHMLENVNTSFEKEFKRFFLEIVHNKLSKKPSVSSYDIAHVKEAFPSHYVRDIQFLDVDLGHNNLNPKNIKAIYKDICDAKDIFNKKEEVHHTIFGNKDGDLSWRNFQILHPLFYVFLVNVLTEQKNWKKIKERFKSFRKNKSIICTSYPVVVEEKASQKKGQILSWWQENEQESISLSLDYKYMSETDISDCYPSIYTHSIAWAIEGKEEAKEDAGNMSLLGNQVDKIIQNFQNGQTNGIPQGSILMDFIAEIVLGYIDELLTDVLNENNIFASQYKILRYRDDYRVYSNDSSVGYRILSMLSQVLIPFGLKLNSRKTKKHDNVVLPSIKEDKLSWLQYKWLDIDHAVAMKGNFQKHALLMLMHSKKYPNSGSLTRALTELYSLLEKVDKKILFPVQIIAIITEIAFYNPKTISVCCAIISYVGKNALDDKDRIKIITKTVEKLRQVSYSSLHELWIQRLVKGLTIRKAEYEEKLCKLVDGEDVVIWKFDWISNKFHETKAAINESLIFDARVYAELGEVIQEGEFNPFMVDS